MALSVEDMGGVDEEGGVSHVGHGGEDDVALVGQAGERAIRGWTISLAESLTQ
jgi:hypothetical protein